jgi:hypothetical protein
MAIVGLMEEETEVGIVERCFERAHACVIFVRKEMMIVGRKGSLHVVISLDLPLTSSVGLVEVIWSVQPYTLTCPSR